MSPAISSVFERACAVVFSHEGGFTNDPRDPGNWTGGQIGHGQLRETQHGISAAAYPSSTSRP